ncbi:MAG: hypothetical protein AB8B72_03470 [Crocinitomicaceae bacterium]
MPTTTKIVFSTIAFYIVFGVFTYFQTGQFLTLFFLNYYLIVGLAIYSFVINFKKPQSTVLGLYAIAVTGVASSHSLTLSYLNKLLNFSNKSTIIANDWHKIIAILIFYSLLTIVFILAKNSFASSKRFWVVLLFLIGSLIAVILNEEATQVILLSLFHLSFVLFSNKLNHNQVEVYSVLGFQFILFLVIENIRFVTTSL